MCFTDDGRIVLSASSFRDSSHLCIYDDNAVKYGKMGIFWVKSKAIPLYFLDSSNCEDVIRLPPYSEETTYENRRLLILFESASDRFRIGRLTGGEYVYSMCLRSS
jgi:hypothetical protein